MTQFIRHQPKARASGRSWAWQFLAALSRFRPRGIQVLCLIWMFFGAAGAVAQEKGTFSAPPTKEPLDAELRQRLEQQQTAASATATAAEGSAGTLDNKQKLGVGDRISFRVLEDQEPAKLLTITDAGELDVPELGLVTAAGKSCKELAHEIKTQLEQTTYFKATVIVGVDLLNKTPSGRKVYVVGQVRVTGPQDIPAGETWTVSRAIMKAGGFTNFADKKKVRLVRGGATGQPGQTFYVNVSEIWEKGRTDRDLAVQPEDLIYVSARAVNFY